MTIEVAAQVAETKSSAVRYAIENGQLPATKHGKNWLVAPADLFQWIDKRSQPKQPSKQKSKPAKKRPASLLESFSQLSEAPYQMARLLDHPSSPAGPAVMKPIQGLFAHHPGYTKTEKIILEWVAGNCKTKDIAAWLTVSVSSVKGHLANIVSHR